MQKVKEEKLIWSVMIVYSGAAYPVYDDLIRKTLNKVEEGSGMGMGERDLSYDFRSANGAKNFAAKARNKLRRLKYLDRIVLYDPNYNVL